jgi:RHH-type proline utilization regulon transcriptional repressor/proline dehydrogenase/delta 1-pyrroline-5-carboxylate dehydrogenase
VSPLAPFRNEPVLELRRAGAREQLAAGLAELEAHLPVRVPVWIGDERREGDELVSTDPGNPERVVAIAAMASEAEVDAAVGAAREAFGAWSRTPAQRRAEILVRAAGWLRRNRAMLAALAVRECAKPWGEADGDVCEAIDFLEFYARGAVALDRG